MTAFWVFLGGGLGSVARFGIGKIIGTMNHTNFPLSTFISNILACIILVLVIYQIPFKSENQWLQPFLVAGFCGGFSTFSTFSYENFILISNGNWGMAVLNVLISLAVGIGVMFILFQKLSN